MRRSETSRRPGRPRARRAGRTVVSGAFAVTLVAWGASIGVRAQEFGLGRPPTADEVRGMAITIPPSGAGLPEGRGTAAEGKAIYETQCARCHGATGREGPQDVLAGGTGSLATAKPVKTVGSYWPYATTLFDYVRRAMPFDRPGTLSSNDVYAVVAHVLQLNGIVSATDVLDAASLPRLMMPNRNGFYPYDRPDAGTARSGSAQSGGKAAPVGKRATSGRTPPPSAVTRR